MKKIFQIYDSKAEYYLLPAIIVDTKGLAIRTFQNTVDQQDSVLNRYPEDFTLFETGTWDEKTGITENIKAHIAIGKAIEFKNQENNNG